MTRAQKPGRSRAEIEADIVDARAGFHTATKHHTLRALENELAALTPPHATTDAGAGMREVIARIIGEMREHVTLYTDGYIADTILVNFPLRPDAGNADYARGVRILAQSVWLSASQHGGTYESAPFRYYPTEPVDALLEAIRALPQLPAREDEEVITCSICKVDSISPEAPACYRQDCPNRELMIARLGEPAREDAPIPVAVEQVTREIRSIAASEPGEDLKRAWRVGAKMLETAEARALAAETALRDERARGKVRDDLLREVQTKGLIYWEPKTSRGFDAKANMNARIDAVLTPGSKAQEGRS